MELNFENYALKSSQNSRKCALMRKKRFRTGKVDYNVMTKNMLLDRCEAAYETSPLKETINVTKL